MPSLPRLKRLWNWFMDSGAYRGETEVQRGKRRIVVGYIVFSVPPRLFFGAGGIAEGFPAAGGIDILAAVIPAMALGVLRARPRWFTGIVNVLLFALLMENVVPSIMFGGIAASGLLIAFGLLAVMGALIALERKAAFWWFVAFVVSVALTALLPEWIDPLYEVESSDGEFASLLIAVAIFLYAGMAYFVRQRDHFQQQSDDLLHNILPDEIATRLKSDTTMIADDYESASVLFADVVNFTPMSAGMTPPELVGLLNNVFTTFDGFVAELGLEKIKTVGDEYMVAAGVPKVRPDHAHAMAELALRIRHHTANNQFDGHAISLRIGINSGPVVAGVVGTHKFAYDLWGDAVNTASRMESEGIPGSIQITPATYELIRDEFVCEPRGVISVKGKGDMSTYLLISKRADVPTP